MKTKKTFNKKLGLSKETVSNLSTREMVAVYGGVETFGATICRTLCITDCAGCNTRTCY